MNRSIINSILLIILYLYKEIKYVECFTSGVWSVVATEGTNPAPCSTSTAVVYEQNIYTFGGYKESQDPSIENIWYNSVHVLNTTNHVWTLLNTSGIDKPEERGYHASFIRGDEMIVCFGGSFTSSFFFTGLYNDIWAYNITSNEWRVINYGSIGSNYPEPRFGASITYDPESDQLILFGGVNEYYVTLGDTWTYKFENNQWKQWKLKSNPSPRYNSETAFDPVRRVMIIYGGEVVLFTDDYTPFFGIPSDIQWEFSIQTKKWVKVSPEPDIPDRNNGNGIVYYNGKLLMHGGDVGQGDFNCTTIYPQNIVNETWIYDIQLKTWTELCPSNQITGFKRATTISVGNKVYTYGGWSFDNSHCTGPIFNYDTWVFVIDDNIQAGGLTC